MKTTWKFLRDMDCRKNWGWRKNTNLWEKVHSIHAGADRWDGPLRNSGSTTRDSQKSHIPAAVENCTLLSASVSLSLNLIRWETSSYRAVGRTYSEQKKRRGNTFPTMALAVKRGEDQMLKQVHSFDYLLRL